MKVKEKLLMDLDGLCEHGPITIVAFGDSVTHGCIRGMDYENVYWNCLRKKLNAYRNYVPVNMINAGIGGTLAKTSVARLDKHVLNHDPDLVIICYGLNDSNGTKQEYLDALKQIGPYLCCTHVHDNYYEKDLHLTPFLGNIKWEEHMKYLAESGYQGKFSFELVYGAYPDALLGKWLKHVHEVGEYLLSLC